MTFLQLVHDKQCYVEFLFIFPIEGAFKFAYILSSGKIIKLPNEKILSFWRTNTSRVLIILFQKYPLHPMYRLSSKNDKLSSVYIGAISIFASSFLSIHEVACS